MKLVLRVVSYDFSLAILSCEYQYSHVIVTDSVDLSWRYCTSSVWPFKVAFKLQR